jgi:chain length determinant protein EpsF
MNLTTLLHILRARWLTIASVTLLAILITGVVSLFMPRTYTATNELIVDAKAQDPISGQLLSSRMIAGYLATQVDIVRSRNVAEKVIEAQGLQLDPQLLAQYRTNNDGDEVSRAWLLGYLKGGLSVAPKRESSVLGISFSAEDPELAARVANAFATAYIHTSLELRVEPARQITQWYEQQLGSLRETLMANQNALTSYQEERGIVASDRVDVESAKLAELSSMLTAAQSERLDTQSRNDQATTNPNDPLSARALENPQIQQLSSDLVQAQARLRELNSQVGTSHPDYRQALAEVDTINRQLNRTTELVNRGLRSSVELSQSREEQLKGELEIQKNLVLQLNRNRNQLNLLQQEVDSAQAAYDAALGRSIQTRLESQIAQTDVAVLNFATAPVYPTSPRPKVNLLLASIFGLLLGGALALCREWLDRRVRSADDLVNGLGLPVLAYIPSEGRNWAGGSRVG